MTNLPKTSSPAGRALESLGVKTLEDLSRFTEKEIAELHGMGKKALRILKAAMAADNLTFKDK